MATAETGQFRTVVGVAIEDEEEVKGALCAEELKFQENHLSVIPRWKRQNMWYYNP